MVEYGSAKSKRIIFDDLLLKSHLWYYLIQVYTSQSSDDKDENRLYLHYQTDRIAVPPKR